jgi:hypothetical protein
MFLQTDNVMRSLHEFLLAVGGWVAHVHIPVQLGYSNLQVEDQQAAPSIKISIILAMVH